MTPRHRLVVAAVAAVVVLAWWLWWRSPSIQAPKAFAALAAAIQEGDPGGVLARIHPEYDYRGLWPDLFGSDEMRGYQPKPMAYAGLKQLFEHHRADPITVVWQVHEVRPRDDGAVDVIASLRLTAASGHLMVGPEHALDHHRFVLARDGWSAALLVRGHDPIALAR